MNKESQMIDKLIEIDKQMKGKVNNMKETKIENQTVVVDTENKDIELYALIPDGKNTWRIVNEDNIFIMDIHDYDIESVCESICVHSYIERYSAEEFIEHSWEELTDNFSPQVINCTSCENWDKFCAWYNHLVVEYLTTELINIYNNRLLNFE